MTLYTNGSKEDEKSKPDRIDHQVGNVIKLRRMILGLSQQDLSKSLGVSVQQIQKYEKAINRVSSGRLYALSKCLKIPVSYFFEQAERDSKIIESVFSEDSAKYEIDDKEVLSEKEIISLIKYFSLIKKPMVRKKFLELMRAVT